MKPQATRRNELPRARHEDAHHRHIEHQRQVHDALRRLDLIEQQHNRRADRALSALVGATLLLCVVSAAGLIFLATGGPI